MKKPKAIYLKDYTPPSHIIDKVDLTFDLFEEKTIVTSKMTIHKNGHILGKNKPLILDKADYEITGVMINGKDLLPEEYTAKGELFKLDSTLEDFELGIITEIKPQENTSLEGLYKSGDIFCTQCESEGFRKITPFIDRPDVMAIYSCTIRADKTKYPVLLSNGNPVKKGDLEDNRHYVKWQDPYKKPSYLFALVAGDLGHIRDTFITGSGREVQLKIYSEKANIDKCDHAMESLKQAMKWDEDRFGLEYDLDLYQIVAINDFNFGAMENKGLNIFNSKYVLADPKTATDEDFFNVQSVIGHEYFHNWTGNRVTLKNWFQLSLKEGLTVFRDQEFSSDLNSRSVKRISTVKNLRASQFPEDSGSMSHPVMPSSYIKMENFYTTTVYQKGSELVRMIHQFLGEEKFQKGMAVYFEKFDGMAVTINDFVGVMEEVSNLSLKQFKLWYTQSGTPHVSMTHDYNKKNQRLIITLKQETPADRNQSRKEPFHIPIRFGILDSGGKDITPKGFSMLELKTPKQSFHFDNIPANSFPSIFRQFSAPVKITSDLTDSDLAFLMTHDKDDFNRWDAAQNLFLHEIKQLVSMNQQRDALAVSKNLLNAFQRALASHHTTDRAFLAKTLTPPPETEIKDHFDEVDVEAIHHSRQYLCYELAKQLKSDFIGIIEACSKADPKSITHEAIASRSLKNLALSYLSTLKENDSTERILEHYNGAQNMTDEFSALACLCNIDKESKEYGIKQFYEKWHHDKLVLDKWFSVQAASGLSDTLDRVKDLKEHRDFALTNPNKVRSLLSIFALHNQINFHRPDGKGYRFIADQIIEFNGINHHIAARLSSCFNHWKRYDRARRDLMKKELERIIAGSNLSENVYEVVARALE